MFINKQVRSLLVLSMATVYVPPDWENVCFLMIYLLALLLNLSWYPCKTIYLLLFSDSNNQWLDSECPLLGIQKKLGYKLNKKNWRLFRCASISSSDDRDSLTHSLTTYRLEIDSPSASSYPSVRSHHSKQNVTHNGMELKMAFH